MTFSFVNTRVFYAPGIDKCFFPIYTTNVGDKNEREDFVMKKQYRAWISGVLAIAVLLCMLPTVGFGVHAAGNSGTCGPNLTWTYSSATGTLRISGTGPMTIVIGNPLVDVCGASHIYFPLDFPPLHTERATFTALRVPSLEIAYSSK